MIVDTVSNQVYVRHWNSNPSPRTQPRFNVSLGLVSREQLQAVLHEQVAGCCGTQKKKYTLANANDLSIWNTGRLGPLPENCVEE